MKHLKTFEFYNYILRDFNGEELKLTDIVEIKDPDSNKMCLGEIVSIKRQKDHGPIERCNVKLQNGKTHSINPRNVIKQTEEILKQKKENDLEDLVESKK